MKDQINNFEENISAASLLLKAISSNNRLKILCKLSECKKCGCEILEDLNMTQPALSQNLKLLTQEGIIESTKVGTKVYYEIVDNEVKSILEILSQKYCKNE